MRLAISLVRIRSRTAQRERAFCSNRSLATLVASLTLGRETGVGGVFANFEHVASPTH